MKPKYCLDCGVLIENAYPSTKRCKIHAAAVRAQSAKKACKKYDARRSAERKAIKANPEIRESPVKRQRKHKLSISEINQQARSAGMTYGQYMARGAS